MCVTNQSPSQDDCDVRLYAQNELLLIIPARSSILLKNTNLVNE